MSHPAAMTARMTHAPDLADEIARAGRRYTDALERELRADEAVVLLRARLVVDLRHDLERHPPLSGVTDKEVEAALLRCAEYRDARELARVPTVDRVRAETEREPVRPRRDVFLAAARQSCG